MIFGWTKKQRMLVVVPILTALVALWACILTRIYIDNRNLRQYGIIIKARIIGKEIGKHFGGYGNDRYKLSYLYKGNICSNVLGSELNFKLGDTIRVKINSRNPQAYCELVN